MQHSEDIRDFSPDLPIDFDERHQWGWVIADDASHISSLIFKGNEDKFQFKGNAYDLTEAYTLMSNNWRMTEVVDASNWHHVCKVKLRRNDCQVATALFERWWDTTHTFHLPSIEVGFTPLDFTAITGIPVGSGNALPWIPIAVGADGHGERERRWALAFPERAFDDFVDDRGIKCAGLKDIINSGIPTRRRRGEGLLTAIEIERLRAFFLLAIGEMWFPNNRKVVACEWLDVCMDVTQIGTFDWGSAIMAQMYRGLDRACRLKGQTPQLCWFVLQYWFYEHIGQPAPVLINPNEDLFPRILRWAPEKRARKRK